MTKKRSKHKRNKHKGQRKNGDIKRSTSWVHEVTFQDLEHEESTEEGSNPSLLDRFGIISWNMLAESYTSPRSHRHLPKRYQKVVFDPKLRREVLKSILIKLAEEGDILCLQEVDLHDLVEKSLSDEGFIGISTPKTNGGGAGGRFDSCCIYWNKQNWELLDQELIRFDDLATSINEKDNVNDHPVENKSSSEMASTPTLESNLQGFTLSFLRRNVGMLVRLRSRIDKSLIIVVANAHLFWNPLYDYVKLCQAHYLALRCKRFSGNEDHPVILCGDLNSKPGGPVHTYFTQGRVNAKLCAPWYDNGDRDEKIEDLSNIIESTRGLFEGLNLERSPSSPLRYILDFTLNRFCRWLRILGIDAALETDEEEIERTKNGNLVIFARCRDEGRTLITTSSKLLQRKDCPPGAYLMNPKTQNNLEVALVHLLTSHGAKLQPKFFLTRCVICNGQIKEVKDLEKRKCVLMAHSAPLSIVEDDKLDCFQCCGCGQGFWWCDSPTSSASRVKEQAARLFKLCLRAGILTHGPLHMFDFINVEEERKQPLELDVNLKATVEVVDWLKQIDLKCPLELESSYALRDEAGASIGECKPFTNVTHDFVGFLDYVFYNKQHLELSGRLNIPGSFKELNENREFNAHLLPSDVWPSDHLAVGAQFSINKLFHN